MSSNKELFFCPCDPSQKLKDGKSYNNVGKIQAA
jgi:hypothetical protein